MKNLLCAIEVLNYFPSNMNIQPFQRDDYIATSSNNIDTHCGLSLDNNSNDKMLSSVESKLNGSIFMILNYYKHDVIV